MVGYWFTFLALLVWDSKGRLGNDIGIVSTIRDSAFARGMFADIGGLSSLASLWILFGNNLPARIRVPFAIGTLMLGSLVAIPFVILYLLLKK